MNASKNKLKLHSAPAERIKLMRSICGLTREQFEKVSGVSGNTLRAWEEGTNNLTKKGAARLEAAFLKFNKFCPMDWLLYGTGLAPSLEGLIQSCSISLTAKKADMEIATILREMEFFATINPSPLIFVVDDGMQPKYNSGDFVAGNKVVGDDIAKLDGRECIVMIADNQILCRRLFKSHQTNRYDLICLNPQATVPEKLNVEITAAAEIVLHRRAVNS
jgi:transcriptional regulator with XRE-family HTH domain